MRHSLAPFAICFFGLPILTLISGCTSLNGYMMNSSGQAFYENENYAMAAVEFEKAVASAPANPDYTANLARTRFKMGDAAGAEQIYRHTLTTSPGHQPSYHGMAELLVAQGRQQEATAMLSTWSATQPYVAESHLELAWLQKEMGRPDAAAQSLQMALRVNPGHPKALAHLGEIYQDQGHTNQAIAMYQQSLQADWQQPQIQARLSNAIATAGPSHPVNATAMARGAQPQGFGPRMAQQPYSPMQMTQAIPPTGPYGATASVPGAMQASHTAAMPMGMGFGLPMAAEAPTPAMDQDNTGMTTSATPNFSYSAPAPTPDPAFDQPIANQAPATSISHQTLQLPDQSEDVPIVEAF